MTNLSPCGKCVVGQFGSPPPCLLAIGCCWSGCETASCCCPTFGRCGTKCGDENRTCLMSFACVVSIISMLCMLFGALALGTSEGTLSGFAWSQAEATMELFIVNETTGELTNGDFLPEAIPLSTPINLYIGISAVLVEFESFDNTITKWNGVDCETDFGAVCQGCKDSATGSAMLAIMGVVTGIPQITTDLLRSHAVSDLRCQKGFGIGTGIYGMLSTISAMQSFAAACVSALNDTSEELTVGPGPGYYAIMLGALLKLVDVFIHIIVPVPNRHPLPAWVRLKKWRDEVHDKVEAKIEEVKVEVAEKRAHAEDQ